MLLFAFLSYYLIAKSRWVWSATHLILLNLLMNEMYYLLSFYHLWILYQSPELQRTNWLCISIWCTALIVKNTPCSPNVLIIHYCFRLLLCHSCWITLNACRWLTLSLWSDCKNGGELWIIVTFSSQMTFSSANSVCIIGTLAESPHTPAFSHRLSVIPISFNSALLHGLLALKPTCLSSHSKFTTINWTRILYNASCIMRPASLNYMYLCAWNYAGDGVSHDPFRPIHFCSHILDCDDACSCRAALLIHACRHKKKIKAAAGELWSIRGFGSNQTLSFITWVSAASLSVFLCWAYWVCLCVGPYGWPVSHCGTPESHASWILSLSISVCLSFSHSLQHPSSFIPFTSLLPLSI